jgi:hypothetical protein
VCIIKREKCTAFRVTADSTGKIVIPKNVTFPVIIDYAVGRGSVVGIGIHCRLDGPEIETRWVRGGPRILPASNTMDTGSFPGVKRPKCGVSHPHNLALRLKKGSGYNYTPL